MDSQLQVNHSQYFYKFWLPYVLLEYVLMELRATGGFNFNGYIAA